MGIPETPTRAEIVEWAENCAAVQNFDEWEILNCDLTEDGSLKTSFAIDTNDYEFNGYSVFDEDHVTVRSIDRNCIWRSSGGLFVSVKIHGVQEEDQYDSNEFEEYLRDNVLGGGEINVSVRESDGRARISAAFFEADEVERVFTDDRVEPRAHFTRNGSDEITLMVFDREHPDSSY